ncbi:hypothetical protein BML2526_20720 [Providencia rettgeri]|nr:hypothetical protein BML2526_20720 [Providencia rettgeri]BBV11498.1 hypothetical protein BML2576_09570 [Providencia rettgeri]BDH17619.1 hypothetical protein PrNR1418_09100 [Providencia rettgeri]
MMNNGIIKLIYSVKNKTIYKPSDVEYIIKINTPYIRSRIVFLIIIFDLSKKTTGK